MTNQNFDKESYVSNFLSANKEELVRFSKENGFSFSEEQLVYMQSHFRDEKKALPTYNQLCFFNKINEILISKKRNLAISSVSAKDAEASIILDTAKDLLEKKKLCQKKLFGSAPISYVARTASEYLRYVDCCENKNHFLPSSQAQRSNYYVHLNDNIPLFSLADVSKNATTSNEDENSAIALLYPIVEMTDEEYSKNASAFFGSVKTVIADYKTIPNYLGLLEILYKETDGIFVDLSRLPNVEKDGNGKVNSLDPLVFSCVGYHVFDISPSDLPYLNSISAKYGLAVVVFATRNDSELFILDKTSNPAFCFKFDFISRLINYQAPSNYIFASEKDNPVGKKRPVFLSDKSDSAQRTYMANKLLSFTQTVACASSRDIIDAPYKTSAVATLDAITSLIVKGIPKSAITLSIHYNLLSETDDETELGKNFASILGAYRTMIELCVSDFDPQISYNSTARNITVLASAKKQIKSTKSSFGSEESFIYFMPFAYDDYGIPDYQKYREAIKLFYALFEKDEIGSAFYVNENLFSTMSNASSGTSIDYSESFNFEKFSSARGILFETKNALSVSDAQVFVAKNLPKVISKE